MRTLPRPLSSKTPHIRELKNYVAITLGKVETPDYYGSVGNKLRVGKSMVGTVDMGVCKAVAARIVKIENVSEVIAKFKRAGFLSCADAIEGCIYLLYACYFKQVYKQERILLHLPLKGRRSRRRREADQVKVSA